MAIDPLSIEATHSVLSNEYLDFLEFLESDMGFYELRECRLRFYESQGDDETVKELKEQWNMED